MATLNEKMTALADAVREKTGETALLTLDGITEGVSKAYVAGAEAAKKEQYDEFWDNFQDYGKRTKYMYAFYSEHQGKGWNDKNFKPKYDIKPVGNCSSMFWQSGITDLTACGVEVDFSKGTNFYCLFYYSTVSHVGVIDVSNGNGYYSSQMLFAGCTKLVTVDKLIYADDGSQIAAVFEYCTRLENIVIEGVIGQNLELGHCRRLTLESIESFINALQDFSGTETSRTVTLHADAKAKLSDSDIAVVTQKGWTFV